VGEVSISRNQVARVSDLHVGRLAVDEVSFVIVLQLTPADSAGQHRHVVDVGVGDHRVARGVSVLVLELCLHVLFPQSDHRLPEQVTPVLASALAVWEKNRHLEAVAKPIPAKAKPLSGERFPGQDNGTPISTPITGKEPDLQGTGGPGRFLVGLRV
jgi:hypothetical protein